MSKLHVALLPSSGMGHLIPFLRLAASLIHHQQCLLTLITTHPIVSSAESQLISRFLSAFPQVTENKFTLLPLDPLTANTNDPFSLQWETIRRSAHLLDPIISSLSPPLSFIITDVTLMSSVIPVTTKLRLHNYILFTSSARMFSLFAHFPLIAMSESDGSTQFGDVIRIPGLDSPIPTSSLPPTLLDSNSFFTRNFSDNSRSIRNVNGVLINSFEGLEKQRTGGKAIEGLPPVFPVGPFLPLEFDGGESSYAAPLKWLESQKERSVVYVSFGSRTPMSKEQIRELGNGLVLSGYKFVWVVKSKVVDKEEEETEGLNEILGHYLMEKIGKNGLVIKEWVNQWEILNQKSVGGFISHCGWNSVVEAAWNGVPVLGWPQHGDQMINAEVVEEGGWGMCMKNWGWGLNVLVKGEEIGGRIKKLMGSETFKLEAARISEEAKQAAGVVGGSCQNMVKQLFSELEKEQD